MHVHQTYLLVALDSIFKIRCLLANVSLSSWPFKWFGLGVRVCMCVYVCVLAKNCLVIVSHKSLNFMRIFTVIIHPIFYLSYFKN